jgi:hypothetical protein
LLLTKHDRPHGEAAGTTDDDQGVLLFGVRGNRHNRIAEVLDYSGEPTMIYTHVMNKRR